MKIGRMLLITTPAGQTCRQIPDGQSNVKYLIEQIRLFSIVYGQPVLTPEEIRAHDSHIKVVKEYRVVVELDAHAIIIGFHITVFGWYSVK